jgi:transcriptional regulator with XRE-family HTH domain
MNAPSSKRRRPTESTREATRLAESMAQYLGRTVRAARIARRMTQLELAIKVRVRQAWISRIELGHGARVPLQLWVSIGVALDMPLAVSFSKRLGAPHEPIDAGHLAMQEQLLRFARTAGRPASLELHTRPADPRHSIDVCVRDARHRVLIIQEAWNTFGDIGAAIRSTNRKAAEARDLPATIDDGPPYRVATVWVVRPTAANRALVARYPEIFGSAFPGSSRSWARALQAGAAAPDLPGLVWLDPVAGRISEWRRSR